MGKGGAALRRAACTLAAGAAALLAVAFVEPAKAEITGTGGTYVAFERDGDVWLADIDGNGPEINLTNSPGVSERHPAWGLSTDGCDPETGLPSRPEHRTIAYESDGDIIVAALDGNDPPQLAPPDQRTNLTSSFAPAAAAPAVGVLAQKPVVVFTSGPVGDRDLWAMPLDGTAPIRLTEGPQDDANPDWSDDGHSIVYDTGLPGAPRQLAILGVVSDEPLTTLSADPSGPRLVTSGEQPHADASWFGYPLSSSPQGVPASRLLYATTVLDQTYLDFLEQDPGISPLFDPATAPATYELTGDPGGDAAPSWEPGGLAAAFQSDRDEEGNVDIYRVAWDGTELRRLTHDPAPDLDPDWEAWTPATGGACLDPSPTSPRPGRRSRNGRRRKTAVAAGLPSSPIVQPTIPPAPGLSVRGLHVNVSRVGGRRRVVVAVVVNQDASAQVRLLRRGRVVVTRSQRLHVGSNRLVLRLPRRLAAGRYRLRLTIRGDGAERVLTQTIRLGRARSARSTAWR